MAEHLDLGRLGLDRGGHLLLRRALRRLPVGGALRVVGEAPALGLMLGAWCRSEGHEFQGEEAGGLLIRGPARAQRWRGATRAGGLTQVQDHPPASWGLAARGTLVEAGSPSFSFRLADKAQLWTEEAGRFYAQAAAAQWDPATAIPWEATVELPEEVEDAVVQLMSYLIENENAALIVPARFLGQVHPHFREIIQVLSIQIADEARHVEVFTRRAGLKRAMLG
ncbi:MAG TPA: ferritin-like domain-containing protein, partial [Myxococcota bacterium]|nr:ferritin-like domain-containing protein [Myxococcota bacterium]